MKPWILSSNISLENNFLLRKVLIMATTKKTEMKEKNNLGEKRKFKLPSLSGLFVPIKSMGKKAWLIGLAIVIVLGVFLVINNTRQAQQKLLASMQTVLVKKGDLVAIVGATGTVNANQSASLTWQTNGRVALINVRLNDQAVKDQVLAELDPSSVSQAINSARADLVNAKRNLEDVLQSNTAEADAYLTLIKAEDKVQTTKNARDHWNYKNSNWNNVYKTRNEFLQAANELIKAQNAFDAAALLPSGDASQKAAAEKLAAAQLVNDKALRNLNLILGRTYDNTIAEDFANYDLAKAKADDARRTWERLAGGPKKDDIESAQAKVDSAESAVKMAKIIAPFNGTITQVDAKVGDEVKAGIASFRVDDLSRLLVKVEIPEVDVNRVMVGQRVELTFDAILGSKYTGTVTEVEPVGTDNQGVVNFTVTIELKDGDGEVRPGMTAAVNIVVSEIKGVLIVPNRAVSKRSGTYMVFIMKNNQVTEIPVEIGSSSDIETEITRGDLKEGDMVIVNPPTQLFTAGNSSVPGGGMPGFLR
jgi:HlyD family secretion protein